MIDIHVFPLPGKPDLYVWRTATKDGAALSATARCPLLSAARRLLNAGVATEADTLRMIGPDGKVRLSGKAGSLAKLTVTDDARRGPLITAYRPPPSKRAGKIEPEAAPLLAA